MFSPHSEMASVSARTRSPSSRTATSVRSRPRSISRSRRSASRCIATCIAARSLERQYLRIDRHPDRRQWHQVHAQGAQGRHGRGGRARRQPAQADGERRRLPAGNAEPATLPPTTLPSTHWNLNQVKQSAMLNSQNGTLAKVQITPRGRETIKTANGTWKPPGTPTPGRPDDQWFDDRGRWVKFRFQGFRRIDDRVHTAGMIPAECFARLPDSCPATRPSETRPGGSTWSVASTSGLSRSSQPSPRRPSRARRGPRTDEIERVHRPRSQTRLGAATGTACPSQDGTTCSRSPSGAPLRWKADLRPCFRNLQYFKDLLALPRRCRRPR